MNDKFFDLYITKEIKMKRNLLLILALLGLLATLTAVPRNLVVVEVGTYITCPYCPGAAMGCHDLLQNGHAVAVIKNHQGDAYSNTYSHARNSFYGITGYPTAYFDGLNPSVGGSNTSSMYSNYLPKVNARLNVPAHFTISAQGAQVNNEFQVAVTVSKPEADTNTNVKLHAVVTESSIPQVWFNQTTVDNVNRVMTPNQNGTAIDLATGGTTTVNLSFTPGANWNLANCEVVLFLQNMTSKEILQGVKYSLAGLVGAYPVSTDNLAFPDMYVGGTSVTPVTITNFLSDPASGTISIDNPAFSTDISTFNIPGTSSVVANISFSPTAAQTYTGTLTITSNLYNHPNISIPLAGTGFMNAAPTATDVTVSGPPVINQELTAAYSFNDADGNTEGSSILQWFRIVNNTPQAIGEANQLIYSAAVEDLGFPLAFQVTPVDQHGMPGTAVMSAYTIPIEELPAPQNLQATVTPPSTVTLTWERPEHFEGKGLVGYRLFRNGLTISTITNPNTLTFSDTYVPAGTHEYWICTLFNNPMMLSNPSNVVTVSIGVDNDDQVAPAEISVSVHPNPFQTHAAISIQSKADAGVDLAIYNVRGQLVKSFALTTDTAGIANASWDGTDNQGNLVNSGVYYYRMFSAGRLRNGRIVLMK